MEDDHFSDARFEAILDSMKVEHPEIHCGEGHLISRMCTNPLCKTSLICGQSRCASCGINIHGLCPSVTLDGITEVINQRANSLREIFSSIFELDRQLMAEIESSKKQLAKNYLHPDHLTIIHEVYQKRNPYYLSGQLAKDFCQQIQAQGQAIMQQEPDIIRNYQIAVNKMVEDIKRLKFSILLRLTPSQANNKDPRQIKLERKRDQLLGKEREKQEKMKNKLQKLRQKLQRPKEQNSSILKRLEVGKNEQLKSQRKENRIKLDPDRRQRGQLQPMHSQILNQYTFEQSLKKYMFLMKVLNRPEKVELLYRASQHQFSAQAFHQRCDGVPNTLTLVRTEFGKVIGGFTSYPWQSEGGYAGDRYHQAFLLSLDLEEVMHPDGQEQKLIYNNIHTGPRFGSGHDLFISDQCNLNSKSYAIFPTTYNTRDYKYSRGQKAYQSFSGAKVGNMFKVSEYQVFRVVYNKEKEKLPIVGIVERPKHKLSKEKDVQLMKMQKKVEKMPSKKYLEPKLDKKEKKEDKDKDCSVQ